MALSGLSCSAKRTRRMKSLRSGVTWATRVKRKLRSFWHRMTRRRARAVQVTVVETRLGSGRHVKPEEPGMLSRESWKVSEAYSASVTRATLLPHVGVVSPSRRGCTRSPSQGRKIDVLARCLSSSTFQPHYVRFVRPSVHWLNLSLGQACLSFP